MTNTSLKASFTESPVDLTNFGEAPSLHHVVAHAIDTARTQGLDEFRQHYCAARAVMRIEPDLTLLVALRLVSALVEDKGQRGNVPNVASVIAHVRTASRQ